jgi:TolA-binding protein
MRIPKPTNGGRSGKAVLAGVLALALPVGAARADQYDDATRKLQDLEERVRVMSADFRDAPLPDPNAADRRVIDAELLFTLKNYEEAATILLDVIEKYPNSRAYDDAVVLLADSLWHSRDLNSARRYFELAIKKNTGSRREQKALQRLIELSLRTGDYTNVNEYLDRLSRIPAASLEPSVPYVRGKYHYFRDKADDAFAIFAGIGPSNPYHLQARYFMATIQVKKGDVANALTSFDAVLRLQPRNDADKEIQDLARLALGRLHYERGQLDKAKAAYTSVPRQSKYFSDSMYELAWTSIKAKDYKGAYRSLDLLLLQNPDSPQAPELRLLMGNLNLRLSNFVLASESFGQARTDFEPLHRQLNETLQKSANDPKYFENLLGKGMERFDIALFVPAKAVKWITAEQEVTRMVAVADDLGELQRGIKDSEQTLARLERAVDGRSRVGIFPDLASVRTKSNEVLNQTVDLRRRFIGRMRALTESQLGAQEKAELDQLAAERSALEKTLKDVPLTADGLKGRARTSKDQLAELDARASEFNVQIQSMEAELVAIEQYFIRSRADQKIRPEDLQRPVEDVRAEITEMRAHNEKVRNEISELSRETVVAGATGEAERPAAVRLAEIIKREHDMFSSVRTRLPPNSQQEFEVISAILNRADGVQARLVQFDSRVEAAADRRISSIKEKLATEKAHLATTNAQLTGVVGESQNLGGGLAQTMLTKVTDRFYDLVVQSDVGLVDVSWGLKDHKTSTLSKLINQQKLELKSVEDDFRSLLEEEK